MRANHLLHATAVLALAIAVLVSPVCALEKRAGLAPDDNRAWQAGTSITISYYNVCNGWVWIWDGWEPNDVIGVFYDFRFGTRLSGNWWFFGNGSPAGYGFTGTVSVSSMDSNGCPVPAPVASQSFLPNSAWNFINWSPAVLIPGFDYAITFEFGPGTANPAEVWTDHPAAGPTGAQACGTCYPMSRFNRSWYLGTANSPLCPGSPFADSVCDAQLLQNAQIDGVISVEQRTWSSLKSLYR